jgi:hypothetical protein
MTGLEKAFTRIREEHAAAIQVRSARAVLGSSVIRVFHPGTKYPLLDKLASLDIKSLKSIRTQDAFRKKFEQHLNQVHNTVRRLNVGNGRIHPGGKWGHCTKVLCLYLREIVLHSRLLPDAVVARLQHYLYVPIDTIVLKELKRVGAEVPFRRIKDLATAQHFYLLQDLLGEAARRKHVPRIWFDDVWAVRGGGVPDV